MAPDVDMEEPNAESMEISDGHRETDCESIVGSETSSGSRLSWTDRQLRRRARAPDSLRRASDLEASALEVRPWWLFWKMT